MLRLQRSLGQSLVIRDGRDLVTVKLTHLRGGKATLTIRTTHAQNEAIDFTVGGKTVHMQIGEIKAGTAALAIEAPRGVDIVREELIEQRRLTRAAATEQE